MLKDLAADYKPRILPVIRHKQGPMPGSLFGEVLTQPASPVTDHFDMTLWRLVQDMFETMYANHGVGLAAPQIGYGVRVAVVDISFGKDPSAKIVLVNPVINKMFGKQTDEEGCLSLPGFKEKVTRANYCQVQARNEQGQEFVVEGEGYLARALQHEVDHLSGKLWIDRVSKLKRDIVLGKIMKLKKRYKW